MFTNAKTTIRLALTLVAGLTFIACDSTEPVELELTVDELDALDDEELLELDALEAEGVITLTILEAEPATNPATGGVQAPPISPWEPPPVTPVGEYAGAADPDEGLGLTPAKQHEILAPDFGEDDEEETGEDDGEDEELPPPPLGYDRETDDPPRYGIEFVPPAIGIQVGAMLPVIPLDEDEEEPPEWDPHAVHPPVPDPVSPSEQPYPTDVTLAPVP